MSSVGIQLFEMSQNFRKIHLVPRSILLKLNQATGAVLIMQIGRIPRAGVTAPNPNSWRAEGWPQGPRTKHRAPWTSGLWYWSGGFIGGGFCLDQPFRYNGTEEVRMAAGTYFWGLNTNNYSETPLISFKTYFVFQPAGGVYDASFTKQCISFKCELFYLLPIFYTKLLNTLR